MAAYAGPRFVTGRWDLSALGTGYQRWYGAHPNSRAVGGRVEAMYYATPRLGISAAASGQWVQNQQERARGGRLASLNGGAFYTLTPASAFTFKAGASRLTAHFRPYSNTSGFVAAGYFRELPFGFSAYVEPSLSIARYDAPLIAFGRKRSDKTQSLLLTLLNRHIVLSRFTPRISYSFTRQSSSIDLYQFTRSRIELGFTTAF